MLLQKTCHCGRATKTQQLASSCNILNPSLLWLAHSDHVRLKLHAQRAHSHGCTCRDGSPTPPGHATHGNHQSPVLALAKAQGQNSLPNRLHQDVATAWVVQLPLLTSIVLSVELTRKCSADLPRFAWKGMVFLQPCPVKEAKRSALSRLSTLKKESASGFSPRQKGNPSRFRSPFNLHGPNCSSGHINCTNVSASDMPAISASTLNAG